MLFHISVSFNIKIAFLPLKLHVKLMFQEDVSFLVCSLISHTLAREWVAAWDTHPGEGQADLQRPSWL